MLSKKEAKVVLKFMEMTISRVNQAQACIYATQKALIEKGLISEARLCELIGEAIKLPQVLVGAKTLQALTGSTIPVQQHIAIPDGDHKAALERIMNLIDNNSDTKKV
jgi:hypothetical protein